MHLLGVMLMLPEPELDYFKALARASNDFVVEMESGGTPLGRYELHQETSGTGLNLLLPAALQRKDIMSASDSMQYVQERENFEVGLR